MTIPPKTSPTFIQKALAWGVHLFTATGAVLGLLSILAIQQREWKLLFLWVALSLVVDGFDGYLARLFHTKEYAPGLDGALLDNIVDYLNYVLVPAYFLIQAPLTPEGTGFAVACLILLSSAYQFCQTDAKTDDHYFKGFPDYWNILALYLFILESSLWLNLAIFLICVVLVFVPIKYIYPSRTRRNRVLNQALAYIWGGIGAAALILYPDAPAWLLWSSLVIVVIYLVMSLIHTLQNPKKTC